MAIPTKVGQRHKWSDAFIPCSFCIGCCCILSFQEKPTSTHPFSAALRRAASRLGALPVSTFAKAFVPIFFVVLGITLKMRTEFLRRDIGAQRDLQELYRETAREKEGGSK